MKPKKLYTERQLEAAYCLGFLNTPHADMDELAEKIKGLKERFELAKKFIKAMPDIKIKEPFKIKT